MRQKIVTSILLHRMYHTQTVSGPPTQGVDCPLCIKGNCLFGISGRRGGVCTAVHRKRCTQYLRWVSKGMQRRYLQQTLSPGLPCISGSELTRAYKLHVNKCKRKVKPPSDNPQPSVVAEQRRKKPIDSPGSGKAGGGRKVRPCSRIKCSDCDQ